MAASTVLVLGTLTVTGLWLGAGNKSQDDGYVVDLSTIEQDMTTGLSEKEDIQFADHVTQDATTQNAPTDDLDYDPYFRKPIPVMWKIRIYPAVKVCRME